MWVGCEGVRGGGRRVKGGGGEGEGGAERRVHVGKGVKVRERVGEGVRYHVWVWVCRGGVGNYALITGVLIP